MSELAKTSWTKKMGFVKLEKESQAKGFQCPSTRFFGGRIGG
jgi:hypothetical protein